MKMHMQRLQIILYRQAACQQRCLREFAEQIENVAAKNTMIAEVWMMQARSYNH